MYDESVTVQKPSGLDARGQQSWAAASPVKIRCKVERTKRRVIGPDGIEHEADLTMVFNKLSAPGLEREWRIVRNDGKRYKILRVTDATLIFLGLHYARAEMAESLEP